MTQTVMNPPAMLETWVQSLGWEDPLKKGNRYPLQYTSLENSMDCIVHGVAKSWTQQSSFHFFTSLQLSLGLIMFLGDAMVCLSSAVLSYPCSNSIVHCALNDR